MISSAIKFIGDQISALDWVEVYGGLVQTIRMKQGDAENDVYNVFPISCDVSEADCVENQKYQDLIPDDSKMSIVYFETTTGLQDNGYLTIKGNSKNKGYRVFKGNVRLVAWLNSTKLGTDSTCNTSDMAMRSIIKLLNKEFGPNTFPAGSLFENSYINFNIAGILPKDHRVIFGRYNYLDSNGYWMYPFDFFAIDLSLTINLALCDYDFPDNGIPINPNECVDYRRIL